MTIRKWLACWATAALSACANTDVQPPPRVTFALFDPAATPPQVPTPTDLARDPVTGRINVPLPPNASAAEQEFAAYLESLDAYPPESHATANFSAPLAASSTGSVTVLDLTSMTKITGATVIVNGPSITVIPPGGAWTGGHTFAVAISSGARGADGTPVVASPAFFFARSTRPISNCTAPGPNCTSASPFIPVAQAIGLEQLRQALAPLFAALEANGLPRDQVAVAWTFTISTRPFAAYDPTASRIPFPNDILRNPMTGQVQLPIAPDAPPAVATLEMELNQLTGFSTTARVTSPVDLPPGDSLPATPSGVVTTIPNVVIAGADSAIVLQPLTPLPEKTTFLVALTPAVTDAMGQPLQPPPLMVLLRGSAPLVENGHSTVSILSDMEAAQLEPLRMALAQGLAAAGLSSDQVVSAWSFTTQPTVSVLTDRVATMPPPSSTGNPTPIPANVPSTRIATLISGTFVGSKGDPVPYLLALPAMPTGGLVIFQHGLNGDKTEVFSVADTFARAGLATVAMDLPLNGDRAMAGVPFLNFTDLGALRENLLQGAADLVQLTRTIAGPGLAGRTFAGTPSFVGVSLGGIVGTDFSAVMPPSRIVLSTTGAPLVDIALTSPTIMPMVDQALAMAGVQPGTPQFDQFIDLARMELDAGDPINYAARLPSAATLVQIGGDDTVIPAPLGLRLAQVAHATVQTFPGSQHALLINPMDPNIAAAQQQAVRFVLGGEE